MRCARLILVVPALAAITGCAWFRNLGRPDAPASQPESQPVPLEQQLEAERSARAGLQLQKDRLEAQNARLTREVDALQKRLHDAGRQIAAARADAHKIDIALEARRRELDNALTAIRRSRADWEEALADRQKQIDLLTNQVQRLERQLEAARRANRPSTRPQ